MVRFAAAVAAGPASVGTTHDRSIIPSRVELGDGLGGGVPPSLPSPSTTSRVKRKWSTLDRRTAAVSGGSSSAQSWRIESTRSGATNPDASAKTRSLNSDRSSSSLKRHSLWRKSVSNSDMALWAMCALSCARSASKCSCELNTEGLLLLPTSTVRARSTMSVKASSRNVSQTAFSRYISRRSSTSVQSCKSICEARGRIMECGGSREEETSVRKHITRGG